MAPDRADETLGADSRDDRQSVAERDLVRIALLALGPGPAHETTLHWLTNAPDQASEDAPAYAYEVKSDVAHAVNQLTAAALPDPVSDFLLVPAPLITLALDADSPARLPRVTNPAEGNEAFLRQIIRLLEGARLVGPEPQVSPHPMTAAIGPMMPTNKVVAATGTSRQNLAAQAKNRRLIRLASSQRTQWWPTFQFRRAGSRIIADPGVQALWSVLPTGTVSDWDHAVWMCSPRHDLDGDAPLDLATDADAVNRSPLGDALAAYADRLTR